MNPRIISNYDHLPAEQLLNQDTWDAVELNFDIDIVRLKQWYDHLKEEFSHCVYNFNGMPERLNSIEYSKRLVEEGYCGIYCGPIDGITLSWPIERYEPLPPPMQANLEMFPEVDYKSGGSDKGTFYNDAKLMSRYRTDYFAELVDIMTEDAFRQSVITTHYPGMKILQHIDSMLIKMHIPIYSDKENFFTFGEHRDVYYHFKEGKAYLLNSGVWHGTENNSESPRSHIITRVGNESLQHVIDLR